MSGPGFIKHVVRQPLQPTPFPTLFDPTPVLARAEASHTRGETYTVTVSGKVIEETDAEGLAPKAVVIVLGALAVLWLVFLTLGILCKFFNKPRSQVHAGDYMGSKGLYQPSAAGYGADRPMQATGDQLHPSQDPKKMYGSKTNLLASAGPMGQGSIDSAEPGTPDLSLSMSRSREYFDTPSRSTVVQQPGQHHRTTSSSVGLPGPSASRRGPSAAYQQQPPVAGPSTMTMDPFASSAPSGPGGSGFRPGQVVNFGAYGGSAAAGPSSRPRLRDPPAAPAGPRSSRVFNNQGPPPARADSKRRSKYSRAPRIESVGPGQIRASRYFEEGEWEQDGLVGGAPLRKNSSNRKSRYGDHRMSSRRSQFGGNMDMGRSPSIYGMQAAEEDALRRAYEDGFGAGSPSMENVAGNVAGHPPPRSQPQMPQQQYSNHPLGMSRGPPPPDMSSRPQQYTVGRGPSPLGGANGPRYPAHPQGPAHPGFAVRQPQMVGGGGAGGRQLV